VPVSQALLPYWAQSTAVGVQLPPSVVHGAGGMGWQAPSTQIWLLTLQLSQGSPLRPQVKPLESLQLPEKQHLLVPRRLSIQLLHTSGEPTHSPALQLWPGGQQVDLPLELVQT
jgi:hypothetical protein